MALLLLLLLLLLVLLLLRLLRLLRLLLPLCRSRRRCRARLTAAAQGGDGFNALPERKRLEELAAQLAAAGS